MASLQADFINIKEFETLPTLAGYDVVIAVGGDGTVNTVAAKLQHEDIPLGIIPAGSGDGLARHFNIPKNASKALDIIGARHIKTIDTGSINGQFFINVAGTGFEAEVAHQFDQQSGRGLLGYVKTIVRIFKTQGEHNAELLFNNEKVPIKYFSLTIANGSQWGNNFRVTSQATLNDGLFDVAVMAKPKLWQIPGLILELLANRTTAHKLMSYYAVKEIQVMGAHKSWHIDGEPIFITEPCTLTCIPGSLKIILPNE